MAKLPFNIGEWFGRLIKTVMVVLLIPLAMGLLTSCLNQLEVTANLSGASFREWVVWGFFVYIGTHLLLYRPVTLFRASHRIFSSLAVWLFGGQVTSVEGSGASRVQHRSGKGGKEGSAGTSTQGSTLVAFSPYVVPSYTVLVCAIGWLLARVWNRALIDGPIGALIGMTMALHWVMTADDLQQQRARWHLETYLLALSLVFVLTILIGAACLPWSIPDFSFVQMLSDGLSRTQALYVAIVRQLFF
jgi:hypothetical protein